MLPKMGSKFLLRNKSFISRTIQTAASKKQVEVAAAIDGQEVNVEYNSARPFNSIPGPKPLPIPYVGNMWRLMPFGTYGNMDLADVQVKLHERYGSIVKFTGLGSFDHVLLFEPELAEKVFRNESIWPRRYALPSLVYYRKIVRKDFYENEVGLVASNDQEWHKFRTTTNQVMLNPKSVLLYLNSVEEVCEDFVERIRFVRKPDEEMPDDFFGEINKLSLETFMFMTLDKRLGCLDRTLTESATKMIQSVRNSFALMYNLDVQPSLWRIYPTKDWKNFVKSMDFVVDFTSKHINDKWEEIKHQKNEEDEGNRSILESLLLRTKNPKIPLVMASDTLFAAIDTTSSTMASTLYYLAMNPEKQEKLFQELKRLLPNKNNKITTEILKDLKYTRAVIKESLRLAPPATGNQRETVKDIVLDNYQIPKGTTVIISHKVMCRLDKHFKKPDEFIPERWLKSETQSEFTYKNVHPFVYLPFGFGQRSCIGKRFAYLEMDIAIAKIIRNFKVSYHHEPMVWSSKLISIPGKPLRFKMIDRND